MGLGAIVGAALTDHSSRAKGLYVDGLDVLAEPATPKRYAVPLESIEVVEAGAGGVSSMTFRVEDYARVLAIGPGQAVRYHDHALDYPMFAGWVQRKEVAPDFGEQGRAWAVTCVGIEALLDWAVLLYDVSLAVFVTHTDAIQAIVNAAYLGGMGPLRTFSSAATASTIAYPVYGIATPGSLLDPITIAAGTSLREAIRTYIDATFGNSTVNGEDSAATWVTIDFYGGLRTFATAVFQTAEDYATETILNQDIEPIPTAGLRYGEDLTTAHAVFVKGANAAGTGVITDGTSAVGPTAYLTDTAVDSAQKLNSRGQAYLQGFRTGLRGSYRQEARAGNPTTHPGGIVRITDQRLDLLLTKLRIGQITKRYNATTEEWTVDIGGLAPSMVNALRRLTRDARA